MMCLLKKYCVIIALSMATAYHAMDKDSIFKDGQEIHPLIQCALDTKAQMEKLAADLKNIKSKKSLASDEYRVVKTYGPIKSIEPIDQQKAKL